jgi:hypothetical protein
VVQRDDSLTIAGGFRRSPGHVKQYKHVAVAAGFAFPALIYLACVKAVGHRVVTVAKK